MKRKNLKQFLLFAIFSLFFTIAGSGYVQADTVVGGALESDTTWDVAGSPYIVTSSVTVKSGVTLIIDPGVEVKVNSGFSLSVSGTLTANGTDTDSIIFTSNVSPQATSDWAGIIFNDLSEGSLDYAVIEYATNGISVNRRSSPSITNSTIRHNSNGLYAINYYGSIPDPVVTNCSFEDNSYHVYLATSGGWSNSTINARNNWWGTADVTLLPALMYDYFDSTSLAVVDYNSFLDSENGSPVTTAPTGETYLFGATTGDDTLDGSYLTVESFKVHNGHSLTILPGSTIKFEQGKYLRLSSSSSLTAVGTDIDPITFTSAAATPLAGDWSGIIFDDQTTGSISYAVIEYANNGLALYRGTTPSITSSHLRHNNNGIYTQNYYSHIPNPVISLCSFEDNSFHIYVATSGGWSNSTINARNNWWGTADVSLLQTLMYDYFDNTSLAVVDYNSFLNGEDGSPVTTAPTGETYLLGATTGDDTLDGTYLAVESFKVHNGHSLTILPGTTIKFEQGKYLRLSSSSTLTAVGTDIAPITFTSAAATPLAGDWSGIIFDDQTTGSISYAVIEYASNGLALYRGTTPTITSSHLRHNNNGIYTQNYYSHIPNPVISLCSFEDNAYHVYVATSGGWSNSTINARNNWWGTTDVSLLQTLMYDYFDNSGLAVVDFNSFLDGEDGSPITAAPTGETYLFGATTGDDTLDGTYLVVESFKVHSGHSLTILPGSTLKFEQGKYLRVSEPSTLTAVGTEIAPITFTSAAAAPSAGDWGGIILDDQTTGSISHAIIEYATSGITMYQRTTPTVTSSHIRHNNNGIYARNYYGEVPNPVVTGNSFVDNSYHIYLATSGGWSNYTINVQNNWWGTADVSLLQVLMYDYFDNTGLAVVDYSSFLDSEAGLPVTTAPTGETYLLGSTTGDNTLSGSYLAVESFKVHSGHSLTILPGTTIKFEPGKYLRVSEPSTLVADGTESDPISFTSASASPLAGDWSGIIFDDQTTGSISHALIEYATSGITLYNRATPNITFSHIHNNNNGIYARNYYGEVPNPVVTDCSFVDNSYHIYLATSGGWSNSTINVQNNWWGTSDVSLLPVLMYDYFDNGGLAVVDYSSFLDSEDGSPITTAPTGETYLLGATTGDNTLSGNYLAIDYFKVHSGHSLTILPGTTIKFAQDKFLRLSEPSTLTAVGSELEPITFTSAAATPSAGDWKGITFEDQCAGTISYAVIEYATNGMSIYSRSSPLISYSTIRHNNNGIYARNYYGEVPYPVVNYCSLIENSYNYYLNSTGGWSGVTLDATNNWWGTQNELEIAATIWDNADNGNNAVINFDPWLYEILDETGPWISDIRYNGTVIQSGDTVSRTGFISLDAVDVTSGISRVEFYVNGDLVHSVASVTGPYLYDWNIVAIADGLYDLTIRAYDTLDNVTEIPLDITVALAPPQVPVITSPPDGLLISRSLVTVTGSADRYTEITLYNGGMESVSGIIVDDTGLFSIAVPLFEGENVIQARAEHRGDQSGLSAAITVTMDPDALTPPLGLSAEARPHGEIRLSWQEPLGELPAGYYVYRSTQNFSDTTQAERLTSQPLDALSFADTLPDERIYYYALTSVDTVGTESEMTPVVFAESDATDPQVELLELVTNGSYDPISNTMAPGQVNVTMTVSEELSGSPFLSLVPFSGSPIAIALSESTPLVYTGSFQITADTPSGPAQFHFSGHDPAGNEGTVIVDGELLEIDTDGPEITDLSLDLPAPLENDELSPLPLVLTVTLDEETKNNNPPQLFYTYQGAVTPVTLPDLSLIGPLQWQVAFTLAAEAGLAADDTIVFSYEAVDLLDNSGTTIVPVHSFEVYQGDLPPLDAPIEISSEPLPAGEVHISWLPVVDAAGYQIFRQAPGEGSLTLYIDDFSGTEFNEFPGGDGQYIYAIVTIRQANSDTAVSELSESQLIEVDSIIPAAPGNFHLELIGSGIKANWTAPSAETLFYRLYRSSQPISDTTGLTPVVTSEPDEVTVIDSHPSLTDQNYAVTSVDIAGNESAPSVSLFLNFDLLPVAELSLYLAQGQYPELSWSTGGTSTAGYHVYLVDEGDLLDMSGLISETSFSDTSYTAGDRHYMVTVEDIHGNESVGRTLFLPKASMTLGTNTLYRGKVNKLDFSVSNQSPDSFNGYVSVSGNEVNGQSAEVFLAGQSITEVAVLVGGDDTIPSQVIFDAALVSEPEPGLRTEIVQSVTLNVDTYRPPMEILTGDLVRGDMGHIRVVFHNTTETEFEFLTAGAGGNSSPSVHLFILDEQDNVLASQDLNQTTGDFIVTLPDGSSLARIPAGSSYTTAPVDILIPLASPDNLIFKCVIDDLYYNYGQADQIDLPGAETSRDVLILDTDYYAEVLNVDPVLSRGGDDFVISGHAVSREFGTDLANVAVKLGISNHGFDTFVNLATATDGSFTYTYKPVSGDSGVFTTWVLHPDLNFKAEQATFTIQNIYAPSTIEKRLITTIPLPFSIDVTAGEGTAATNLRLEHGVLPQGVSLSLPGPIDLPLGGHSSLNCSLTADETAADESEIILSLVSDGSVDPWQEITVTVLLTAGQPFLSVSPSYLDQGVQNDTFASSSLVLTNNGTADFTNVTLALHPASGEALQSWIHLNSPAVLGDIAMGGSSEVLLSFTPHDVTEGIYEYFLQVSDGGGVVREIPLYLSVTSSTTGNVTFTVADIYTNTLNDQDEVILGVDGAKIRIQNSAVLTEIYDAVTDSDGLATLQDLPVGRYNYRVTATGHDTSTGIVRITPDATVVEEVFLEMGLVTVEWEVTPITIEDVYKVTLKATFETDVPAPVVVCEPSSFILPDLNPGQIFYGEFKVMNHGLIRADDVTINLPANDDSYTYELPEGLPTSLAAKSEISVPFRVIRKDETLESKALTTKSNCCYSALASVAYRYFCTNGHGSSGATNVGFNRPSSCCGDISIGLWGAQGGLGSGSVSPVSSLVGGSNPCPPKKKPEDCKKKKKTGSGVDYVYGEYMDGVTDLTVKVNGGQVSAQRLFNYDTWHFGMDKVRIEPAYSYDKHSFTLVRKGQVEYEKVGESGPDSLFDTTFADQLCGNPLLADGTCYEGKTLQFSHGSYTVRTLGGHLIYDADEQGEKIEESGEYSVLGYLWSSPDDSWYKYDDKGRVVATGTGSITTASYEYDQDGNISVVRDGEGNMVFTYSYVLGHLSAVVDREGRRVEYEYNGDGHLVRVRDVLGNDWLYSYNPAGLMTSKTDPEGYSFYITGDSTNYVRSIVDDNGVGSFFEYKFLVASNQHYSRVETSGGSVQESWFDADTMDVIKIAKNGQLVLQVIDDYKAKRFIDANGNITVKKYNDRGNITEIIYPDGATKRYEFDASGTRMLRQIDEEGAVTAYTYDANGFVSTLTMAYGTAEAMTIEMTYDTFGNVLTRTKVWTDESLVEQRLTTTFEYDAYGNMILKIDPDGHETSYTYHITGLTQSITDPQNHVWQKSYNDAGQLVAVTNPLLETVASEYDKVGNLIAKIFPDTSYPAGLRFSYTYDGHNRPLSMTNPLGDVEQYEYNSDSKRTKTTDAEGKISRFEYDSLGRLVKEIDGNNNETVFSYESDMLGGCSSCGLAENRGLVTAIDYPTYRLENIYDSRSRLVQEKEIVDAEELLTLYEYDGANRIIGVTDKENNTRRSSFNALGRMTSGLDALNQETVYNFGPRGDLDLLTDAKGQSTSFTYDNGSNILSETREMGEVISWIYNDTGLAQEKIYPAGNKEVYGYNDGNGLTTVSYENALGQVSDTVTFSYNQASLVSGYTDGVSSSTFSYNQALQKTGETTNYGAFTASHFYTYFGNGLKKSLVVTDGTGTSYTYRFTYDSANNLSFIEIPESLGTGVPQQTIVYGDYLWKAPQTKQLPGGTTVSYGLDPLLQLSSASVSHISAGSLFNMNYERDKMGNVVSSSRQGETTAYSYDPLYRLQQVDLPDMSQEVYTHDPVGNRLTDFGVSGEWQYNANNHLLSYGNVAFIYDDNGSLTEKRVDGNAVLTFHYNEANRLSEVRDGGGVVVARYWYDPFGRRLKKEVGPETIYYLYNDEGLLAEMDQTGAVNTLYVYKPDSGWMKDPVALIAAGGIYFYHNDHIGTPLMMTSSTGDIVWAAEGEAFGKTSVSVSTVTNNLRLPGQYYDEESGFYYNYQRYYDPDTGRYMRLDPIDLDGGLNLYLYAGANPVNYWDERGESLCGGGDVFVGVVGGGTGACTGMCCENNALYNYRKIFVKIGYGLGFDLGIGGSFSPFDDFGDCPTDTCKIEENLTLGPFTFSVDNFGHGSRNATVNTGLGLSAGRFLVCEVITGKTFIECCNQ